MQFKKERTVCLKSEYRKAAYGKRSVSSALIVCAAAIRKSGVVLAGAVLCILLGLGSPKVISNPDSLAMDTPYNGVYRADI